jgi:hypothetical protein
MKKMKKSFELNTINLITIIAGFFLFVHLATCVIQDFTLVCKLTLGFIGFITLINLKNISIEKFTKWDWAIVGFGLSIGILMGLKDNIYGNPDNFHIALSSSVALNQVYPPILPSTFDTNMSNYHYGVDLISAAFMSIFNINAIKRNLTQSDEITL